MNIREQVYLDTMKETMAVQGRFINTWSIQIFPLFIFNTAMQTQKLES